MKPDPASLTVCQREVLQLIEEYILKHGFAPSMRELCTMRGVTSTNGISEHLRTLVKRGFIRRTGFLARSIVVVQSGWPVVAA